MSKYLKVGEVADALNLSPKTIWSWIGDRRLSVVRLGRSVRIPETELARLVEEGSIPAKRVAH